MVIAKAKELSPEPFELSSAIIDNYGSQMNPIVKRVPSSQPVNAIQPIPLVPIECSGSPDVEEHSTGTTEENTPVSAVVKSEGDSEREHEPEHEHEMSESDDSDSEYFDAVKENDGEIKSNHDPLESTKSPEIDSNDVFFDANSMRDDESSDDEQAMKSEDKHVLVVLYSSIKTESNIPEAFDSMLNRVLDVQYFMQRQEIRTLYVDIGMYEHHDDVVVIYQDLH